jgi:hypothetical protein
MTVMWRLCALGVALPFGVASQTVSIPAVADAGLREVFPTTPGGAETGFRVGNTGLGGGESRSRALVRFDVAGAVPPGAEITEVNLSLTADRTMDSDTRLFELRRVLVSWEELLVSWNQRSAAFPWTEPGGLAGADFSSTVSAAATVGGIGTYLWGSTPSMVADARHWQSNALDNFGWMLLINPEGVGGTARRFYSRENGIASPMLEITYRPPFRIDSVAVSGPKCCIQFTTTIGRSYVVECRDDVASGGWLMLTNLPPAKVAEPVTVCDTLDAIRRFYRVGEVTPPGQ